MGKKARKENQSYNKLFSPDPHEGHTKAQRKECMLWAMDEFCATGDYVLYSYDKDQL